MTDPDPLRFAELLAARVCHDLIGPVGAIANGAELLAEDQGKPDPEVVGLIGGSARTASRRLQFFRAAFGTAAALSTGRPLGDARALALGLVEEGGKIGLEWRQPDATDEARAGRAAVKTLLNLILIAFESLPRGGTVRVEASAEGASGLAIAVSCDGPQARLAEETRAALAADGEASPRTVPAHLARHLAAGAGARLATAQQNDTLRMSVVFPAPR